jgi:hypothetical protein
MGSHANKIVCPHCDHEHGEFWYLVGDPYNCSSEIVTCDSCDKDFMVSSDTTTYFESRKVDCKECVFGEPYKVSDITEETCKEWNEEAFLGGTDHKPHKIMKKECTVCDQYDSWREYND